MISPNESTVISTAGSRYLPDVSAVSWGAIIAGAVAAAALSLILLILGVGLGLSSVSPWVNDGASAATIGISAIVWITVTQIIASGLGGYLAGRLRSAWTSVHTDEMFFRDTAHGFLAWGLATLLTASLLTSSVGAILGNAAQATGAMAGGAVNAAAAAGVAGAATGGDQPAANNAFTEYYVDSLFRKALAESDVTLTSDEPIAPEELAEATRILANAMQDGALSEADAQYLGQRVAQRTNLSQPEAQQRVTQTFEQMQAKLQQLETDTRAAADKARKASAYSALWLFISLLIGAFVASFAATRGSRAVFPYSH
jgi:hypothetical protein